ncbi:MAG: HRDC domain-containing protein [Acidobacteria bacterium]|nr:HRDC domain-containing protein [Acidobacteriota bacterium]
MQARVITLRFNSMMEAFDDAPLRDFIKDKEVLALNDHFFVRNEVPYLAVMVNYHLTALPLPKAAVAGTADPTRKASDESWRHLMTETDVPLFNSLRDWRAARCKQDGVPPYIICTNRQLAALIVARPASLAAIGRIEGFGAAKLEKYGSELLAFFTKPVAAEVAAASAPVPTENAEVVGKVEDSLAP